MGLFRKKRRGTSKAPARNSAKRNYARVKAAASVSAEPAETAESVKTAESVNTAETAESVRFEEPVKTAVYETGDVHAERVFDFFRAISAIPHGSFHTKEISDYLVSFAEERNLECVQDEAFNVIIRKKASEGNENAEPIALQGHIDMVLACSPDKEMDMLTEAVTILEDGDWMYADGTTLGADNGIAVAMMLAVLDDDSIVHPKLECIFTSDEEVGLIGASAIDLKDLQSRRLLNLDSETEGVFCAGCAGGGEVVADLPAKYKNRSGRRLNIRLSGLTGGHSGTDIHFGRANGIRLMARLLYKLYETVPFHLIALNGGDADNAIPTFASAQIQFKPFVDSEMIDKAVSDHAAALTSEFRVTDPGIQWDTEWEPACREKSMSARRTLHLLRFLMAVPTGITHMNPELKGMPRTSLNLGVIHTDEEKTRTVFMVRSGVNTQGVYLMDRLLCIAEGFGGSAKVRSSYPAWEYRDDSPLRELAVRTYEKMTGRAPEIEVIHAGLECGILSGKKPDLDCLSIGPDLENVHTIRERMSISSVKNVWAYLLLLLSEAAAESR